jgi:hypothetical protein
MRVNQKSNAQTVTRGKPKITVNLAVQRIDEGRCTGLGAPHEVRVAAARRNLFEDHEGLPLMCAQLKVAPKAHILVYSNPG